MRHSCTFNELITSKLCEYRQHVTFHFSTTTRDIGMVKGQRDTCSHRDATSPNVQKLSYMRMHQMMNLGEIWLQKLKLCYS